LRHPDAHAYVNADGNGDINTYPNSDGDSYCHGHSYIYADSNGDGHFDPDTYGNGDLYANPYTNSRLHAFLLCRRRHRHVRVRHDQHRDQLR
jgi:hypothetical protein